MGTIDFLNDPTMCYLEETHFRFKDTGRFKVNMKKMTCHETVTKGKQEWL